MTTHNVSEFFRHVSELVAMPAASAMIAATAQPRDRSARNAIGDRALPRFEQDRARARVAAERGGHGRQLQQPNVLRLRSSGSVAHRDLLGGNRSADSYHAR